MGTALAAPLTDETDILSGTSGDSPQERFTSSYSVLLREVQSAGLLARRPGYYITQIAVLLGLLGAIWTVFAWLGNSWYQLILAALLAIVLTQAGFLAHDGAHRQMFASKACNEWTSRVIGGAVAGLSYGWWNSKHNRHHGGPNQEGKDPDVDPGIVAFTDAAAEAKRGAMRQWLVARQGWYFFPLLTLEGLHLHVASLRSLMGKRGAKHRWAELAMILLRLGAYVGVVLLALPVGKAAAFLGLQVGAFGLLLGCAFAPNHVGMPVVPRTMRLDFLRRQVLMSRNVSGGRIIGVAMGGLNMQIEHHLFPSMARPNLRKAAPMVRRFCADNGVTYTQTSLFQAYGIIVRYLNRVGLAAQDTFGCPLAAQLR
jgi:fatty acid desaturase